MDFTDYDLVKMKMKLERILKALGDLLHRNHCPGL